MSLILSGTDGLSDVDGSAATPAIRGTDANTGIFFPAADTIAFAEGGAEVARFDSSGNFGLGVTPSAWQVNNRAIQLLEGYASISSNNSQGCADIGLNCYNTGSAATSGWRYTNSYFASLYQQTSGQHKWLTAASGTAGNNISFTQAMTLDASGNLGIGTTSPLKKLDVSVSTTASIGQYLRNSTINLLSLIDGTSSAQFGTETSHPLLFITGNIERARIDTSGNFIYSQSSLACYVWTSFNPTNTSGTTTNAPATGTGYDTGFVTMVNSSGTLTITFDIAGKYLVSTNLQTSHANTYSNERSIFNLGGTATRATGTQNPTFSGIDSVDANTTATYPIYVSATAAQTITILPTYELTGSGTTAQHTCRPSVTIQYCGG